MCSLHHRIFRYINEITRITLGFPSFCLVKLDFGNTKATLYACFNICNRYTCNLIHSSFNVFFASWQRIFLLKADNKKVNVSASIINYNVANKFFSLWCLSESFFLFFSILFSSGERLTFAWAIIFFKRMETFQN